MSRYNIPTKEPFECIVGYDPPLDTLFAQVIDLAERRREEERASSIAQAQDAGHDPEEMNDEDEADEEREPFVLWIGTSTREITDLEVLRRAVEPYAELSSEMQQKLLWDQRRQSHPPTPFQQQMRDLVERITKDVGERRRDDGGAEQ